MVYQISTKVAATVCPGLNLLQHRFHEKPPFSHYQDPLQESLAEGGDHGGERLVGGLGIVARAFVAHEGVLGGIKLDGIIDAGFQIGRASCRERV